MGTSRSRSRTSSRRTGETLGAEPDESLHRFEDRLRFLVGQCVEVILSSGRSIEGIVRAAHRDHLVVQASAGDGDEGGEILVRSTSIAAARRIPRREPPAPGATGSPRAPAEATPPADFPGSRSPAEPAPAPAVRRLTLPPAPGPELAGLDRLMAPEQVDASSWHPLVAESDQQAYAELRAELTAGPLPNERRAAVRTRIDELCERHPSSAEAQLLRGIFGRSTGDHERAREGFFQAAALGHRAAWRAFALAALAETTRADRLTEAAWALRRHLRRDAGDASEVWQAALILHLREAGPAGLQSFHCSLTGLVERERFGAELLKLIASMPELGVGAATDKALRAGRAVDMPALFAAGGPTRSAADEARAAAFEAVVERLEKRVEELRVARRFADMEEDINGIIAEAEALVARGKLNSAFDKLNEGYAQAPGHDRIRRLEDRLRGSGGGDTTRFDPARLEETLGYILAKHDIAVFDTSVLSMQDALTADEARLDALLKDLGPGGLTTLEEKVAYHKLIERTIKKWRPKLYTTNGVIEEVQRGVRRMTHREARKTFGKSAEAMSRELAPCGRSIEFDKFMEKRLRTLKNTFTRLKTKGGLSSVDFNLICHAFVLAMTRDVALLTNDRGMHEGVRTIKTDFRGGNRNISFLEIDRLSVFTSLHQSHFQLVET